MFTVCSKNVMQANHPFERACLFCAIHNRSLQKERERLSFIPLIFNLFTRKETLTFPVLVPVAYLSEGHFLLDEGNKETRNGNNKI